MKKNDILKDNLLSKMNIGYIELKGEKIYLSNTNKSIIDKAKLKEEISYITNKIIELHKVQNL